MSSSEETLIGNPIDAYENNHVLKAFASSGWFNPQYIIDVHDNEPEPESKGLEAFKNPDLNIFFEKKLNLGNGNQVYLGAKTFISRQILTPDGHPLLLGNIVFTDESIIALAHELGTDRHHEFDRRVIGDIDNGLMAIIAPELIRRPVIKITHSWGTERVKQDVLLLSQLVKLGTQEYLKRPAP